MYSLSPRSFFLVCCGLACLACAKPRTEENTGAERVATSAVAAAPAAPPDPRREAKNTFESKCAACHGSSGHGDGPGAQALDPKPRDFSDPAWQGATTDEQIEKIIREGGPAVGKSAGMPGNPDLAGKAEVLAELVKLVRDLGK